MGTGQSKKDTERQQHQVTLSIQEVQRQLDEQKREFDAKIKVFQQQNSNTTRVENASREDLQREYEARLRKKHNRNLQQQNSNTTSSVDNISQVTLSRQEVQRQLDEQKREFDAKTKDLQQQNSNTTRVENAREDLQREYEARLRKKHNRNLQQQNSNTTSNVDNTSQVTLSRQEVQRQLDEQKREFDAKTKELQQQNSNTTRVENASTEDLQSEYEARLRKKHNRNLQQQNSNTTSNVDNTSQVTLSRQEVQRQLDEQKREFDAKTKDQQQNSNTTRVENARCNAGRLADNPSMGIISTVQTIPAQNSFGKVEAPAAILEPLNNLQVSTNISSPEPSSTEQARMPYSFNQLELQNTAQMQNIGVTNDDKGCRQGVLSSRETTEDDGEYPYPAGVLYSTKGSKLYPDLKAPSTSTDQTKASTSQESSCSPSVLSQTISDFEIVDKNPLPPPYKCEPSAPPEDFDQIPSGFKKNRSISRSRALNERSGAHTEGDELNCSMFYKKFGLVIYNSNFDHSSYAVCRGKQCDLCAITDRTLEAVIAESTVPCENEKFGCNYIMKMADMEEHLRVCLYADLICPLATVFGRCFWTGKINQMKSHFDDAHPEHRQGSIDKEMQLFNFVANSSVVHLVDVGAYNFLFHVKVDKVEQKIYMSIQLIGTPSSANKWSYEVQVYNKREPRRKYTGSDVCQSHGIPVDVIFKDSKCVAIPLDFAMGFVNEARLTYKLYIKKDVKSFGNRGRGRGRSWNRGRGRGGS